MSRFPKAFLLLICAAALGSGPGGARAASFLDTYGFEDDVDLVVAPDGEFMIMCEENEDGSEARIRVIDLDPATGNVLGNFAIEAMGFEHGVDPIILPELEAGVGHPVFVPMETADGMTAGLYVLLLDASGGVIEGRIIHTGVLGFRPDVDGVWTHYNLPAIVFFPMESKDRSIRGVMAIDADPRPGVGTGDFGGCTLLANSAIPACGAPIQTSWLPGLVDAVDPVAYEKIGCCSRLALPVESGDGAAADLLLIDFDPTFEPPLFETHTSVRQRNSAGIRPTDFPGFERDVDLRLFQNQCGFAAPTLLVPVEGSPGLSDVYLLDQDGTALWTFSHDSGQPAGTILGFESGVDLVPMCNLGGDPSRVFIPVENSSGADADVWIARLSDGHALAHAEDPALNPGLTIAGFEIGVDLALWLEDAMVVPTEGPATAPGLIVLGRDGTAVDRAFGGVILGFRRSVDLIVDAQATPRILYVPVAKEDGSDSNLLIGNNPPHLGGYTVETQNPGEVMADFEWDVDAGLVNKFDPGGAFLYLPEEPVTGAGRLRIQEVPTGARLAVATKAAPGLPSSLYFIGTNPLGTILTKTSDLFGLETGLDMANGRGQISQDWQPNATPTSGQDGDSDPTLAWLGEVPSAVPPAGGALQLRIRHANPSGVPVGIEYALPAGGRWSVEILDAAGRSIRTLTAGVEIAGPHGISWDGRDHAGRPVASGLYFVALHGDAGTGRSKLIVLQ